MSRNPLNQIDFYKADHRRQYPEGTDLVYSNFTPRSDHLSTIPLELSTHKVVFFGLQYFILKYLMEDFNEKFFDDNQDWVVNSYKRRLDNALGKDAVPVDHIRALHNLGYLPLEIRALPEGSLVPVKCPVLVLWNTHPDFFWLTNYIETIMSSYLWQPITSATTAYHYRLLLDKFAKETGADPAFVDFQAHDFSFRGMPGPEAAAMSGSGHLTSFVGTDTIPAIDLVEDYYNANSDKELVGASVPATEHSVMCLGQKESELETFRRLIEDVYPKGIVSIVSDTWDFWKVITEYAAQLKDKIMARDGKVVFRPDSGDPVKIICGSIDIHEIKDDIQIGYWAEAILSSIVRTETPHGEPGPDSETGYFRQNGLIHKITVNFTWDRYDKQYYYLDDSSVASDEIVDLAPEQKGAVECLWELYGGTTTDLGYKVLDQHVGLIYGDSITLERATQILTKLKAKGFASSNIVFGVGSFTYQHVTRDTFGFAVKSTYGEVEGVGYDIFKDPVTDGGIKKSAVGRLAVLLDEKGEFVLHDRQPEFYNEGDQLVTVFRDGELLVEHKFSDIRKRIRGV